MTRAFTDVLKDIKRGAVSDELTAGLADLANAVRRSRRKGSITLTLTLSPDKHDEDVVDVQAGVTVKAPRRELPAATFFLGADGGLHRDDPKQTTLEDAIAKTAADANFSQASGGGGVTKSDVIGSGGVGANLRVVAGKE